MTPSLGTVPIDLPRLPALTAQASEQRREAARAASAVLTACQPGTAAYTSAAYGQAREAWHEALQVLNQHEAARAWPRHFGVDPEGIAYFAFYAGAEWAARKSAAQEAEHG